LFGTSKHTPLILEKQKCRSATLGEFSSLGTTPSKAN
jgi:hypothetical protein